MPEVNAWLARAAGWRFGAHLFKEPNATAPGELPPLVRLLPSALQTAAAALAAEADARNELYFSVLGPGGCPATESAYDLAAMANRGPLVAEVSAFYEAFAYPARLPSDLAPDHVVTELDFMGFLALKVAFAQHEGRGAEREIAEAAYIDFRDRHPRFWMEAFRSRLWEVDAAAFARAADWVCDALAAEVGETAHA
jgi:TorA maturation chaperone TorD